MPRYRLRGIDVDFPFEAYECQLVYMEKVIQSLQESRNALLESPTGTGKTLCLLCATLAWRKSLGDFTRGRRPKDQARLSQDPDEQLLRGRRGASQSQSRESLADDERMSQSYHSEYPMIIYASRTHSQIRQVIQELKRSSYRPKMVVLGSREQLCIHDQVRLLHGKAQTNTCHALCKKRTKRYCSHFSKVTDYANKNPSLGDEPVDIEDFVNIGRSSGACPYYLSREIHKDVDILFAPYNYLIDRGNRKSLKIDWTKSILIFDEAHNLESICADAASFDLPSSLLTACISEANSCKDLANNRREMSSDKSCNPDDFALLKGLLLTLEMKIAEVPIKSKDLGFTKPGPYIYELLATLNITDKTVTNLIHTIEKASTLLEEDATGSESGGSHKTEGGAVCRLDTMGDILKLIYKDSNNAHAQYYRVHVREVEDNAADTYRVSGKTSRTLSWWCFNPGVAMEEFIRMGVGSVILTSGTLSPMDSFAEELKLDFPIRLENPHVISGNQLWAGVSPVGPSGYSFNSSYRTRGTIEYKLELGNAIVNFSRIVPDGLLIFFPSYYVLEQCINCWKATGQQNSANSSTIWERICKHKLPVVEPRQSSVFSLAIEDYMTKLKDPSASGAIFFAVCRGKVSEGLDFADHAGRAVVITGLPFATLNDPKVRLKREYLDQQLQSQKIRSKGLSGEAWYSQQASRAVNQAVGRVIRHRHDYGAIIFCDERFAQSNRQSQVSLWIQPHIKCYSKFGDIVYTLTRFFKDAGTRGPTKVEMAWNLDQEDITISQSSKPMDTSHIENRLLSQTTSTFVDVKQGNISAMPREVVPANRSSLSLNNRPFLDSTLKFLSDLTRTGKEHVIDLTRTGKEHVIDLARTGKEHVISEKKNVIDLDGENDDLNANFMPKKRKLVITGPTHSSNCEKVSYPSRDLVMHKKMECPDIFRTPNSQGTKQVLVNCQGITEKKTDALVHQGDNDVASQSASDNGVEKKGTAFLVEEINKLAMDIMASGDRESNVHAIMVREKLSGAEYKEFLGFMQALKSKDMKIGNVIQSIASLFSLPDRTSLLHGFKEFVPAKYRSSYHKRYLCSNCNEPFI